MITGRKEWSLDTEARVYDGKTEAEFLAQSIADVNRHYMAGLLDQKTVDWLNLIQCVAVVYGSRIVAIRMSPRPKPVKQPTPAQTAQTFAQPATTTHVTDLPNLFELNGHAPPAPDGLDRGEIPGIGEVQFPDGHPLNFKNRH